ncbi:MAG: hypothetical protein A2144_04835 [Chloroflexi bacterium RBG_16_50_9]|nr:MAG: hypothetical protein A2144_04835 [Chloroflexi bacterium RBG_16_50_9]
MVRRICTNCRTAYRPAPAELTAYEEEMKQTLPAFNKGTGCNLCAQTGYRGRTGLFEILVMSEEIRAMLLNRAGAGDIRAQSLKEGMINMRHDGMIKVAQGITSISEVLRSVFSLNIGARNQLRGNDDIPL